MMSRLLVCRRLSVSRLRFDLLTAPTSGFVSVGGAPAALGVVGWLVVARKGVLGVSASLGTGCVSYSLSTSSSAAIGSLSGVVCG